MHINSLHDVNRLAGELHKIDTLIAYYMNHRTDGQMFLSYDSASSHIAIPITDLDSALFNVLKEAKKSIKSQLEILGVHA